MPSIRKSTALSTTEAARLAELEDIVDRGFTSGLTAMAAIHDERLYRATHKTFEAYARDRWNIGRSRAYQGLDAASVLRAMTGMSTIVDIPKNEAQTRELAKALKAGGPDAAAEAWTHAQEHYATPQPTAKQIAELLPIGNSSKLAYGPSLPAWVQDVDNEQEPVMPQKRREPTPEPAPAPTATPGQLCPTCGHMVPLPVQTNGYTREAVPKSFSARKGAR